MHMCVCLHLSGCTSVCSWMYVCTHIHISLWMMSQICMAIYACIFMWVHKHLYVPMCMNMCPCMFFSSSIYMRACKSAYMWISECAHLYMNAQTSIHCVYMLQLCFCEVSTCMCVQVYMNLYMCVHIGSIMYVFLHVWTFCQHVWTCYCMYTSECAYGWMCICVDVCIHVWLTYVKACMYFSVYTLDRFVHLGLKFYGLNSLSINNVYANVHMYIIYVYMLISSQEYFCLYVHVCTHVSLMVYFYMLLWAYLYIHIHMHYMYIYNADKWHN